jgi:mono/diheme cytochrome c family protein
VKYICIVLLLGFFASIGEATCRRVKRKRVVVVQRRFVVLQDVQRDRYYTVGDQQYQELLIQAAMARLLLHGSGSPPARRPLPPPSSGVKESLPPAQRTAAGSYQEPKLVDVVKESCVKCHGPGSKNGVLMLADGKLADISEGYAWKSFGLVNSGEMPKASEALVDDKVQLFYEWAKAQKGKR